MVRYHARSVHPSVQWTRSAFMFSSAVHFRHCSKSIGGPHTVCARKTFPTPSCCHHLPVLLLSRQMAPMTSHSIRSDHHPKETWIHPIRHWFPTPQQSWFNSSVLIADFSLFYPDNTDTQHVFGCCNPFEARESSKSCLLRCYPIQQSWIWMGFTGLWLYLNSSQHSPLTTLIQKRFSFYIHRILFALCCAWKAESRLLCRTHYLFHTLQPHDVWLGMVWNIQTVWKGDVNHLATSWHCLNNMLIYLHVKAV